MNIKLEEFVKEYICMEQDIQIEDLKESIMQYGRMRSKIESTMEEIEDLKKIDGIYQDFDENGKKAGNVSTDLPVWKCSGCRRISRGSMIRSEPEKKASRYRSIRKQNWSTRAERCKKDMRSCCFV